MGNSLVAPWPARLAFPTPRRELRHTLSPERPAPLTTRSSDDRNERAHELLPAVYSELKRLAGSYLRNERAEITLEPTALVHEAFIKVQGLERLGIKGRTHLISLAAIAMRQILIDHLRTRMALKRGGDQQRISLTLAQGLLEEPRQDLGALEAALSRYELIDPRAARVVELKFFGGLTEAEIGRVMDRSERWVRGQWALARAWLRRELERSKPA